MTNVDISLLLEQQREFFNTGKTLDITFRLENLKKLRSLILSHEKELGDALLHDFGKPYFEVVGTETRFVIAELNHMIANLRKWSRKKKVRTPFIHFPARSYIVPQPYGQVLILSPWNYPVMLSMIPAMGALAAGNCVVMKISQKVIRTGEVMARILDHFPKEMIALIRGEHDLTDHLLNYSFNHIFFTGSTEVGRKVARKAAENLTPVTLELGGKSPCVIAEDARLDFAARRIASGKFMNAGQACIAPDYLIVDAKVKERFLDLLVKEIKSFYGDDPEASRDYCRMINADKTARMESFMKNGKIVSGGTADREQRYVAPTIITDIGPDDPVMQEEIFGPVLPVLTFNNFSEAYTLIGKHPGPLAAYIFTRSKKLARDFLSRTQSGTAAVNDTVMQIASPHLPFGGVGPSGIGRYHGRKSFETFSNMKSVLVKSNLLDLPVRYPPYTMIKERVLRLFMR